MSFSFLQKPPLGKLCTNSSDVVRTENNLGSPASELPLQFAVHSLDCLSKGQTSSVGKVSDT